jgi:hypothetical protein
VIAEDDLEEYEKRVQSATEALDEFASQILDELDIENGGVRWWKDHCDWKRIALISEYLIASTRGAAAALTAASLAADTYRRNAIAESEALARALATVRASNNRASIHDFAAAIPRDSAARRRVRTISSSAEHCLFHLGQVLDRLAAVIIIAGGFGVVNVFRADWKSVTSLGDDLKDGSGARPKAATSLIITRERVQAPGSPGREVQLKLFETVFSAADHGATEWLEWTRETRNGMTHRPPIKELNMITADGVVRLLFRHPKWTEVQALAFGDRPRDRSMTGTVLLKPSADVLDGLCSSMTSYASAIMNGVVECWNARKADPTLIIQNASQWQSPEPADPPSNFPGYGEDIQFVDQADTVVTHPSEARLWQAARVFDGRRHEWRQ